ncbi:MAG TPA: MBL fold metallo-hydrolase [Candidatus Acidoferrales bacterium]|nr:MBL fold metallo-hydrolase [Candidatus Acidoferrales bacterium]
MLTAQTRGSFRVRFWGVRGSYPTSDQNTLAYGGHTSCVEVEAAGHRLIFDAGTGVIGLGEELQKKEKGPLVIHLFLSHTHHDHISGFYFFAPLTRAGTRLFVFGPYAGRKSLQATLAAALDSHFFPIGLDEFGARTKIYSLRGGEAIFPARNGGQPTICAARSVAPGGSGRVTVVSHKSHAHPKNGVMLYRVTYGDRSMVYATDVEERAGGWPDIIEFAKGTDLLIHDAQYLNEEYFSGLPPRRGWGHTTIDRALEVARKAEVKRLVLFHHEPAHNDRTIRQIESYARRSFRPTLAAREGLRLDLGPRG